MMAAFFDDNVFPLGLPIGRLVQGDCYELQTQTDSKTGQVKVHPAGHVNAGQPVRSLYLLVAYAKADPAFTAFRAFLANEAKQAWPQYHEATSGACTNPTFADKVIDGDGRDDKGKAWSDRAGFAGHWVVRYGSTFLPKVFEWDPSLGAFKETEPGKIKLGDYIKVSGTTQSNNSRESPGMYVNPSLILFDHEGERIVIGPTADQAFRAPGAAAPPPPAAPTPPAPPYDGHMAPPPPGPTMTAKAGTHTYESMRAAGWTDAQLIEQGYMVTAG